LHEAIIYEHLDVIYTTKIGYCEGIGSLVALSAIIFLHYGHKGLLDRF